MMHSITAALWLGFAFAPAVATAAVPMFPAGVVRQAGAQQTGAPQQDAKELVSQFSERASAAEYKDLWNLRRELVATIEKDSIPEKLARTALKDSLKTANDKGKLVLGAALSDLDDDKDYSDVIASAYMQILESKGEGAEAAASLLASPRLSLKAEHTKRLEEVLARGELAPHVRLGVALALWKHGASDQKSIARKEVLAFFRSDDRELRIEGALALASIDDVDQAKPVLREISSEPSDRGQLARVYLDREEEASRWRAKLEKMQALHDERSKNSATRVTASDTRILEDILDMIREKHIQGNQYSREELVAAAARGMLNELDRHSTFMTPAETARMLQGLNQNYAGIGARVQTIGRYFTIVRPFFSGPAYRAGVRSGDQVTAIISETNGVRGEWSTENQPDDEIIKRLKGEPGTNLTLKVMRFGWPEPREISMSREQIRIPLLESELLPGGIAYFDVQEFGREMPSQLVADFKKMRDVKAIVLDLRNNPGGYLDAAVSLSELFLPKGSRVCYTEERSTKRTDHFTRRDPLIPKDVPVVVLINEFSASASEITAGALQDYGRAVIVGERSYGKGSVQRFFEVPSLPDEDFQDKDGNGVHDDWEPFTDANGNGKFDAGPRVKLTVERWFLPGGRAINTEFDREKNELKKGGIQPDVKSEWPLPDLAHAADIAKIEANKALVDYVRNHWDAHKETFKKLALADNKDETLYPEFDKLYESLKTTLPKNDVRRLVRWHVRDKVAEERGKLFPGYAYMGDVEEDPQLRDAMDILLRRLGGTFAQLSEYQQVLAREKTLGIDFGPHPEKANKPESAPASKNADGDEK